MREPEHVPGTAPEPAAPPPPRFMSQDEDEKPGTAKAFYFSSAAPAVATTVTVAAPPKPESLSVPEPMRIAEAEPASLSRDYAAELPARPRTAVEPEALNAPTVTSLFGQNHVETERDLDVPTFMRRSQF
jgi:hypothetical protein